MKNEYEVTWKIYKSWAIESMFRGKRLAFMIFWLVLGTIFLFGAITDRIVYLPFFALYCFYRAVFRNLLLAKKQYGVLAKNYGMENWKREISFEENEIILAEGNVRLQFSYEDIRNINEKGDKIWITFKNLTALRLYHSAFVHTDWMECKRHILSHKA